MTKIAGLCDSYTSCFIKIAGEQLLQVDDAINFVHDCKKLSIVIVGLEFFEQKEGGIMPVGIADYSELSRLTNAVELSSGAAMNSLLQVLDDKATLAVFTLKAIKE